VVDFCVADGDNNSGYAVSDTSKIHTIDLTGGAFGKATLISAISPSLPSGYRSLMNFNPVVGALRLIGSDCSNYAVVNMGWDTTTVQTSLLLRRGTRQFPLYLGRGAGDSTTNTGRPNLDRLDVE
jgi:hypothetical protein